LCCLWYLSSALSSNTGKAIMSSFKYPVTLTIVQFGFISAYCMIICSPIFAVTKLRKPTAVILKTTIPMAAFQVGGHISSSMAISRIPVSTVHTIKVRNTVLLRGMKYRMIQWVADFLHRPYPHSSLWPHTPFCLASRIHQRHIFRYFH
jgi:solute carrier family 35 protein E1